MARRPTESWRLYVFDDGLYPEALVTRTDAALTAFEANLHGLMPASDEEILKVVERVVKALNEINAAYPDGGYETGERENLCEYIDASLVEAGVEVEALEERQGIGRGEITDVCQRAW